MTKRLLNNFTSINKSRWCWRRDWEALLSHVSKNKRKLMDIYIFQKFICSLILIKFTICILEILTYVVDRHQYVWLLSFLCYIATVWILFISSLSSIIVYIYYLIPFIIFLIISSFFSKSFGIQELGDSTV